MAGLESLIRPFQEARGPADRRWPAACWRWLVDDWNWPAGGLFAAVLIVGLLPAVSSALALVSSARGEGARGCRVGSQGSPRESRPGGPLEETECGSVQSWI